MTVLELLFDGEASFTVEDFPYLGLNIPVNDARPFARTFGFAGVFGGGAGTREPVLFPSWCLAPRPRACASATISIFKLIASVILSAKNNRPCRRSSKNLSRLVTTRR